MATHQFIEKERKTFAKKSMTQMGCCLGNGTLPQQDNVVIEYLQRIPCRDGAKAILCER